MERNKGKIITVYSSKGGVGKTILTLNLAAAYHSLGLKTLIIDLDLFSGGVATYLNSKEDKTISNLVEDLTNNRYESVDEYTFKYSDDISIIASPKDPRDSTKIEAKYLPLILRNVIYKYDVILIDTSHTFSEINICALDNSNTILYVFTNDIFDIKNTRSFMAILKDLEYNNCYTLLNEAIRPSRSYYSIYDIRTIIKHNVDFTLPKSMYVRNIDKYLVEGQILTLNKNLLFEDKKDEKQLKAIASKLIESKEVK